MKLISKGSASAAGPLKPPRIDFYGLWYYFGVKFASILVALWRNFGFFFSFGNVIISNKFLLNFESKIIQIQEKVSQEGSRVSRGGPRGARGVLGVSRGLPGGSRQPIWAPQEPPWEPFGFHFGCLFGYIFYSNFEVTF